MLRTDAGGAPCAAVHPRQRGRQALGDAVAEVMHVPFHVKPVMLSEQLERVDLVGELEADSANLACVLAAPVEKVFDGDLDQGGGLVAGQLRPVEHWIGPTRM